MSNIWGIDLAFGASVPGHIPAMKAAGLSFFIARVGEGLYEAIDGIANQVKVCKDNGIPLALYYAIHPWYDPIKQVDRFLANLQGCEPTSLWLDFELHGNETVDRRNEVYWDTYVYLCKKMTVAPVGVYTAPWFIDAWCPPMKAWAEKAPRWYARYNNDFNPETWGGVARYAEALTPFAQVGYTTPQIWQFAGDKEILQIAPGHKIDYNVICERGDYLWLFKHGPAPVVVPPVPTVPYRVINLFGTYLKAYASWAAASVRWLAYRTVIQVDEAASVVGWKKIADGWVDARRVSPC